MQEPWQRETVRYSSDCKRRESALEAMFENADTLEKRWEEAIKRRKAVNRAMIFTCLIDFVVFFVGSFLINHH